MGYAASAHISVRLPSIALHSAVRAHRPALGCIHRSACGIQYLMRGYRELLREYGLIPVVNDADALPTLKETLKSGIPPARKVVDVSGFATWNDVVARADEFIRTLFSSARINGILEEQTRTMVSLRKPGANVEKLTPTSYLPKSPLLQVGERVRPPSTSVIDLTASSTLRARASPCSLTSQLQPCSSATVGRPYP